MGAYNSYVLPDTYNDAYMAMDDAVVVPAVKYLTEHLLVPLAQEVRKQREKRKGEKADVAC